MFKGKEMKLINKFMSIIYLSTVIILPLFIILGNPSQEEPILGGKPCDLKNIFLVKYCEDDKKTIAIVKRISGNLEIEQLKLSEELEEHKSHKISDKLMCLKFAYGCPKCLFWARSFVGGNCPYCGGKLVKSKYWSPIVVIFNSRICLFSGIFPHIKEE